MPYGRGVGSPESPTLLTRTGGLIPVHFGLASSTGLVAQVLEVHLHLLAELLGMGFTCRAPRQLRVPPSRLDARTGHARFGTDPPIPPAPRLTEQDVVLLQLLSLRPHRGLRGGQLVLQLLALLLPLRHLRAQLRAQPWPAPAWGRALLLLERETGL